MQGHLHQQQQHQLVALLSAALPQATAKPGDDSSSPASAPPSSSSSTPAEGERSSDSDRVAALNSLHRTILYPPNSLLVAHSAPFLSQGFSQLLSDRSYLVRRAAAIAYGSLCSVLCSTPLASNGRQNHAISGGLVDRFVGWALPLVRDVGAENGATELALEGLREFLGVADVGGVERYLPSIVKSCQELLEDERTSLNLLHRLLGLLTLISLKFGQYFHPHFVDIVDLLLGWALMPDLSEADRHVILDSFLQFKDHWLSYFQCSISLLSKFLGDMEVLVQDGSLETAPSFGRLLALFSCFLAVLQVTASGVMEMNLHEQIGEPLEEMVPRLLGCLAMVGKKFGLRKLMSESLRCLTLLAEVLQEKFSKVYAMAIDVLFESLKQLPSKQVLVVLKTNLQLLSLQKLGLLPSPVHKLLLFKSPFSQLRLHPNHLVVGSLAATYLFLIQHACDAVLSQAIASLIEELELLRSMYEQSRGKAVGLGGIQVDGATNRDCNLRLGTEQHYSDLELIALIKFDLTVLSSCVSVAIDGKADQMDAAASLYERAKMLSAFLVDKLDPFDSAIQESLELQLHVVKTLHKLGDIELRSSITRSSWTDLSHTIRGELQGRFEAKSAYSVIIAEHLKKYSVHIVKSLHDSSPLPIKQEALQLLHTLCATVINMDGDLNLNSYFWEPCTYVSVGSNLLFSVFDAASDRECNVRCQVASVLELLLQARLIHLGNLYSVTEVALERLGDPDISVKKAFLRVLSIALPLMIYTYGIFEGRYSLNMDGPIRPSNNIYLNWKHILAHRQTRRQLHSHQLVSILSYVSQRWKAPLSSWIQRLVFSCHGSKDILFSQQEEVRSPGDNTTWMDGKIEGNVLDKICPVNNLAAVWWSIHEAARSCIALRLRTNLGGPTQTFAALERMLLDIAHVLLLDAEPNEGTLSIGSPNLHLLPMRLLLDFVEALKKNVYNAYEGSSILPCTTRQSSLFFRANKKVCEEWFSRICEPMMNAALALHCHDAIFHYCVLRLQDLQNAVASTFRDKPWEASLTEDVHNLRARLAGDILKVLRHAALALCRSCESEALVGLHNWVTRSFSSLFVDENQLDRGNTVGSGRFSWITGLVYQAQGHYEKAAAHFAHLLESDETLSSMGSDGVQFAIARVIESYTALSDWKSLETWLSELQALRAKYAGKVYSGALTAAGNEINAIHALARFDEGDIPAAWAYLDLTPKSSNELTLDPKLALERSEQMLLRAMLHRGGEKDKVLEELEKAKLMLDEALAVVPLDGLTEAAPYAAQLYCISAFEEGSKFHGEDLSNQPAVLHSLRQVLLSPIAHVRQDCSLWLKLFRVYRTVVPNSPITLQLCQKLIGLARKQSNFMMADRMTKYLKNHLSTHSEMKYPDFLSMKLHYETILLNYAEGKHEEALLALWSFIRSFMLSPTTVASASDSLKAKACLKLSTWLRQDYSNKNLENVLYKISTDLDECYKNDASSFTISALSASDGSPISSLNRTLVLEEIVGTSIKLSCQSCPTMGKTWLSYASWCLSQARSCVSTHGNFLQTCSLSPVLYPEILPDRFQLTEEEASRVEAIIESFCNDSEETDIASGADEELGNPSRPRNESLVKYLVQQAKYLIQTAAGAPSIENSNGECPSSALASQLHLLFLHASNGIVRKDFSTCISKLVDIWWPLRCRRVSLFGHAARGFLQYLSYSSSIIQDKLRASPGLDSMKDKAGNCTLRATLYVLHILLNYGLELRDTLESGLATVPLLPWQDITPQLFARLSSHPYREVRKQLEGLLMMLAKLSPWSVVYPTLVDINAYEGEPSEELQHILDCLCKLYPKLIRDVQLVINELGTITVLWEEQWLSTLQDLHSDVLRRINMLKEEASRIAENTTLSYSEKSKINAAKYSAMMAPIVVALERRLASTSRKPETAHETWFQEEYGEQLKSAIVTFKAPPVSTTALGEVWKPFDAIVASLATYQRKSSISLAEVAPRLALLSSSDVPMPGLEKQTLTPDPTGGAASDLHGLVTISSFYEHVSILSTKTKPKKLVILGSDGQKYTYLLKGREDLRLDARIMQLLQAANSFLNLCRDIHGCSLVIRYYSVTPISGRAGLIQWVDNVISMYSVFKSWQSRVQHAQISAGGTGITNSTVPPVPRPSDMFYGKIIPALKDKGIRRVISRRDWPHEVKRKVLLELMKETPSHLLHQELWCASEGFRTFTLKSKRFSASVAAMSMVGHILGLGDRHLDNILMDFSTGDIVHIDYNISFDKGRRLKIPEIVPFRLTQTMESALGLTGTEGTFRVNCETVVSALRKNKDILLMLLEVFVWDPLVEWTRGDSHDEAAIGGEEKKGMELAVSLSLFASRFQEVRVPLQEHHNLLIATLPEVESALEKFSDVLNRYEVVSAIFYHADKERSNLLQHETSAKVNLAEATSISEKARANFEVQAHEFAQAKAIVFEKAQEAAKWIEQHGRVLDALRSGSVPEVQAFIRLSSMEDALSLASAVVAAGVPLTVVPEPTQAQCNELDREIFQLVSQLDSGISCAIESLQDYALALQRFLPLNYIATSPVNGWAQVLQLSVNNISSDMLSLSRRQASELLAKAQGDGLNYVQKKLGDFLLKLQKYALEIQKGRNEVSELMNSIGSHTEENPKDRLLSAFTRYARSAGYLRKEDEESFSQLGQVKHEKRANLLSVLRLAANAILSEVKDKLFEISNNSFSRVGWRRADDSFYPSSGVIFREFEEQIEKCALVAGIVNELQQLFGIDSPNDGPTKDDTKNPFDGNWASIFQASMHSSKIFIEQMIEVVLPEILRSVVSYNSEVMEAFGSLSQIRGSIDTALEQLVEVELEKISLEELERNYFVKVGLITEQQLVLEEAAVKGRDHLSWEEAEELATQEEACRAQLDQLHQNWNQKDIRTSSLSKREGNIRNLLISSERHFQSLMSIEEGDLHIRRKKALLATLVKPFSELESIDQILSPYNDLASYPSGSSLNLAELAASGCSLWESVWRFNSLLRNHSFLIWKVGIVDSFLDSCIHDISTSVEHNFGFDQLYNVLKKKLEAQLQEHVHQYLRERVAPALLVHLERENENLQPQTEVKELQQLLEEYSNAHETARAARSAVSLLKRQVSEDMETLQKTILEIVQMEWLEDIAFPFLNKNRVVYQNFLADDKFSQKVLNLNRSKLLESIQSAMSSVTRSFECLQACERTSASAEGQLERAMGWACGSTNLTGAGNALNKSSGIPSEFHDHLMRRRQLLWAAQEQASNITRVCTSVMEFEASRDGLFRMPGETSSVQATSDGRLWQQTYMNALTRLDVAFHSFTRAEQEWKLAKSSMDAASNDLFSATNELRIASVKAKSAAGDLQDNLSAMKDYAYEASVALSTFSRVSKGHTALTSECGSMLEEVLAITEGLHDVYLLGKEAAAAHSSLMEDLSKANKILLPLETALSTDVAAMADALSLETESNIDILLVHGQALCQSYCKRLNESCQSLRSLVPSLIFSVKEVHIMLTKLARTASLHAGNLHKALQGLGESDVVRSEDLTLSRSELATDAVQFDNREEFVLPGSEGDGVVRPSDVQDLTLQDEEWISPPETIYGSTPESSITSIETSDSDSYERGEGFSVGVDALEVLESASLSVTTGESQKSVTFAKSELQFVDVGDGGVGLVSATQGVPSEHLHGLPLSNEAKPTHADHLHPIEKDITEEVNPLDVNREMVSLKQIKGQGANKNEASSSFTDSAGCITKRKNAYALSVLRQVEKKLDGRDIEDNRSTSISEQVDHLIKQATSIDNLCEMYEGWTPWI